MAVGGSENLGDEVLENAVLAHLTGTDAATAAGPAGMSGKRLARVADRYRTAGRAAIAPAPPGWVQANLTFTDYAAAETIFRDVLWPALQDRPWWFVRKKPCWRLRCRLPNDTPEFPEDLSAALDSLMDAGVLSQWNQSTYEPETAAFGGRHGLAAVHTIHAADASGLFTFLDAVAGSAYDGPDRRVASLMALSHLMRAAGLEWNEQGDVWARVQAQRPPAPVTDQQAVELAAKTRSVLAADLADLIDSEWRFASLSRWATGMQDAGEQLADVVRDGQLQTGIRTVLARAVVFCWNRAGFTTDQQAVWARAARLAILG